jgi:hypothetical protein
VNLVICYVAAAAVAAFLIYPNLVLTSPMLAMTLEAWALAVDKAALSNADVI